MQGAQFFESASSVEIDERLELRGQRGARGVGAGRRAGAARRGAPSALCGSELGASDVPVVSRKEDCCDSSNPLGHIRGCGLRRHRRRSVVDMRCLRRLIVAREPMSDERARVAGAW